MGWLKGSTDITNLQSDVYDLLTGAAAAGSRGSGQAGNGVTLSVGDRWTGHDSTNKVIRSATTESPFRSEWGLYRGCPRFASRASGTILLTTIQGQLGKPTFTGAYNGGTARVYFACYVSTANSSPGNLTGLVITYTLVNSATGATVTSGTTSGWTGASDTKVIAQGVSLTLTLGGSDTFVGGTNAIMWMRAYTTTYTQGIDYHPDALKLIGTLTIANSSGGANAYTDAGTDYSIVQEHHAFPGVSTTIGFHSAATDLGSTGCGCGIAWNSGGTPPATGANYFVAANYTLYTGFYHIGAILSIGSVHSLTGGPMEYWDATLGTGRSVIATSPPQTSLNTTASLGQVFTNASNPGSTFINYWISCTASKIIMVLRGDPGNNGRIILISFQRYTALHPTVDKWPWAFLADGVSGRPNTYLVGSRYAYDQANYWGDPAASMSNWAHQYYYANQTAGTTFPFAQAVSILNEVSTGGIPTQNPNNWDSRYWLYTLYLANTVGGATGGTFSATKRSGLRGKLRGIYAISNDGFSNLETLTDTSNNYLIVIPTTTWPASAASETFATFAILNE